MRNVGFVLVLSALLLISISAKAGAWVDIQGTIRLSDGTPICAMVLANGQFMFSCEGAGAYNLNVPLDEHGEITLFSFADGFSPFSEATLPGDFPFDVEMAAAAPDSPTIGIARDIACTEVPNQFRIRGAVLSENEDLLCAMLLANGQHMFSCGENLGSFDLTVPADWNGEVTLFAFADGFQPYSETFPVPSCEASIVGSWGKGYDPNVALNVMVFHAGGTYFAWYKDLANAPPRCPTGGEIGTYHYDPIAEELVATQVYGDFNGDCGLGASGTPLPPIWARVDHEQDALEIGDRTGGFQTFPRVKSAESAIVGAWGQGFYPTSGLLELIFYPQGNYFAFEKDGRSLDPRCPGAEGGPEFGSYRYDPVNELLELTGVVRDNNGECGLADSGDFGSPISMKVDGDWLTIEGTPPYSFARVK